MILQKNEELVKKYNFISTSNIIFNIVDKWEEAKQIVHQLNASTYEQLDMFMRCHNCRRFSYISTI